MLCACHYINPLERGWEEEGGSDGVDVVMGSENRYEKKKSLCKQYVTT